MQFFLILRVLIWPEAIRFLSVIWCNPVTSPASDNVNQRMRVGIRLWDPPSLAMAPRVQYWAPNR